MRAYVFQAALYCDPCGASIRARLKLEGKAPEDPADEDSFDSDDFPKGPYPDGGGEADSEQNCEACGVELENPLTAEGMRARAERMGRKYLTLEPEKSLSGGLSIGHSAEDLRGMLDALEAASERLPLTEEGEAVVDSMLDLVKAELQKIEYRNYATVIH